MYVNCYDSTYLDCSVEEIESIGYPSLKELKESTKHSQGIVLAVTGPGQGQAHKTLLAAGFKPLVSYRNYNSGHSEGSRCILWAQTYKPIAMPKGLKALMKKKRKRRK